MTIIFLRLKMTIVLLGTCSEKNFMARHITMQAGQQRNFMKTFERVCSHRTRSAASHLVEWIKKLVEVKHFQKKINFGTYLSRLNLISVN